MLRKSGRTWDEVIEPRATFDDIDEKTVNSFTESSKNNGRLPDTTGLSVPEIFDKLRLTENENLRRAAIVLFGKDLGKFYPNIFVKIGRFEKDDADIKFQEVEDGNLIKLIRNVINQLNHKFLIHHIHFEGMYRIEKGDYPNAAIREMILNALVHRNYMGAPTQLRVYDDKINIWNEGSLPKDLTLELLKQSHSSRPRNPLIADVCFKGGLIDAWGRGTIKILDSCKEAELPEPELIETNGGFLVTLFKNKWTKENLIHLDLNERQLKAIKFLKDNLKITNKDYQQLNNCSRNTATKDLSELINKEVIKSSGKSGAGSFYILA